MVQTFVKNVVPRNIEKLYSVFTNSQATDGMILKSISRGSIPHSEKYYFYLFTALSTRTLILTGVQTPGQGQGLPKRIAFTSPCQSLIFFGAGS